MSEHNTKKPKVFRDGQRVVEELILNPSKKRGRPPKAASPVQTTDIEGIREDLPELQGTTVTKGIIDWNKGSMNLPKAKPDNTEALQTFLKAVYRDGELGNRRSLKKDIETLRGLL